MRRILHGIRKGDDFFVIVVARTKYLAYANRRQAGGLRTENAKTVFMCTVGAFEFRCGPTRLVMGK